MVEKHLSKYMLLNFFKPIVPVNPTRGRIRRAFSPPLKFTPPPPSISALSHSHSLRLHWTLRCFPRLAVAVWTMFACRASWQRCGPLARLSINRAHLYRDGEDRLICLVKFCLYLLVISFAVYLLCFGLSRSANFVISRISTLVYTENVFELICVIMYNCLAR